MICTLFLCAQTDRCYCRINSDILGDGEWYYLCMVDFVREINHAIVDRCGVDCCEWLGVAFGG